MRFESSDLEAIREIVAFELHKIKGNLKAEPVEEKKWLTNKEAMEYLGLSKSTLSRFRQDGTLSFTKLGNNIYYLKRDIDIKLKLSLRRTGRESL